MKAHPLLAAAGIAALAGAAAAPARADPTIDSAAMAELLFDEGRRLLAAGRAPEACAKFADSERLDHGVGTLLNLADCYEKAGRPASAWVQFRAAAAAAAAAGQADREIIARERMTALAATVPRLAIRVPPRDAGLGGLQVTRDDVAVEPALWGVAVPVDPGPHRIDVRAPRKKPVAFVVDIPARRGVVVTKSLPQLDDLGGEPAGGAPGPFGPASTWSGSEANARRWDARTWSGVALLGAGAIGVAAGSVFGVRAIALNGDSSAHCVGDRCDSIGVSLREDARTNATVSTVAFISAGVLAAAGVAVLVVGRGRPRSEPVTVAAAVAPGGGAVALGGGF